jgi:CDGSH iron-sulfur domain-containing protein 3
MEQELIKNEGFPRKAGNEPIAVKVEAGKTYAWCTCGLSDKQPFCDGQHKKIEPTILENGETTMPYKSLKLQVEDDGEVWLCTCKQTKNPPFCDGSHKNLI